MKFEKKNYLPRDISWLYFNGRVLQEATDPTVPLIERLRFLGIYSNNLDEFYRVRVATLKRMQHMGKEAQDALGEKPEKILENIYEIAVEYQRKFNYIFVDLIKELEKNNIYFLNEKQLNTDQAIFVKEYFTEQVRPALVPIMLNKNTKFPYLKDKSIYLAIRLQIKEGKHNHKEINSIIQLPSNQLSRFVELPAVGKKKFIMMLDDVIRYNLSDIYYVFNPHHIEAYNIKITRDAELDIDNDLWMSYAEKLEEGIKKRKRGRITRFVYDHTLPKDFLEYLVNKLKIEEGTDVIPGGGRYHNFRDFMKFPHLGHKELLNESLPAVPHKDMATNQSLLGVIGHKDIMLNFPYQKFSHVIDILREAAIDPDVTSIKITFYRVAESSSIAQTLINALKNGKHVTAVVELQARFDEENNMYWAEKLQEEGAKVVFGVPGLKVHSKLFCITRKEEGRQKKYCYIGTGNFNENTSKVYTDNALLTADERITGEVEKVFEFLETNYKIAPFKNLLVSPFTMREKIEQMIDMEIKNARAGKPAHIWVKVNSLTDFDMIDKLYLAGRAGVKIKLLVRGVCSLIPGIVGLSENIEAISIIDRFLEHNRVFIFHNGGQEKYYISSADLMGRNLDQRAEVCCPIFDETLKKDLKKIIEIQWKDTCKARFLDKKNSNNYRKRRGAKSVRSQVEIYNYFSSRYTKV